MRLSFLLIAIFFGCACAKKKQLDPKATLVWGQGLDPEIVMPVRYFFIQAVDNNGKNMTDSAGVFNIKLYRIQNGGQILIRARAEVLDRNDGTYIVRYRHRESVKDMYVEVLYKGKHVGNSPYFLEGWSYHEWCNCPDPDLDEWMAKMGCQDMYPQIERDLFRFKTINNSYLSKEIPDRYAGGQAVHFVVLNNKVYYKSHARLSGFKMYMEDILLSLTRKVKMPDLDFFLNLGDWPLVRKEEGVEPLPVVAWCGSEEFEDVLLPTYDVTRSTLEAMDRLTLDLLSVQGNTGPKWKKKEPKGFFRGRDSNKARLTLVRQSIANPDILDAKLNSLTHFKNEKGLGEMVKRVSFYDFFKYKYQVSIDGTVAGYRMPYLLGGDTLVMKQDSVYYEHFYKDMVPYEHYIPIKNDLSNLLDRLRWARDHDKEAKRIAKNGQKFMQKNLMPRDVFCYHAAFFKEWAGRQTDKPHVYKGMELLPQQDGKSPPCECQAKAKKGKTKAKKKNKAKDEL